MAKENFNDLLNKVKSNNQPKTIQKIVPITSKKHKEVQFSFHIEKTLLKTLKQKALNNDDSIKNTIIKAIKDYL